MDEEQGVGELWRPWLWFNKELQDDCEHRLARSSFQFWKPWLCDNRLEWEKGQRSFSRQFLYNPTSSRSNSGIFLSPRLKRNLYLRDLQFIEHIHQPGTVNTGRGLKGRRVLRRVAHVTVTVFLDCCLSIAPFQQSQTLSLCPHCWARSLTFSSEASTHSLICCLFGNVFQSLEPTGILGISHSGLHLDAIDLK